MVYFVESRNPEAISNKSGRLLDAIQKDQHLVALDLEKGKVRWEKPYDFSNCEFMQCPRSVANLIRGAL